LPAIELGGKLLDSDKPSNLLPYGINYNRKRFELTGLASVDIKVHLQRRGFDSEIAFAATNRFFVIPLHKEPRQLQPLSLYLAFLQ
jgi:hypothetical protein